MERYQIEKNCILRNDEDGSVQLTNWTAEIVEQITYHDGNKKTTQLVVEGKMHDDVVLPAVTINATEFASMGWVPEKWGMDPVIFPGQNAAKDIAVCIQLQSKPKKTDVYTHTGWCNIGKHRMYLTAAGGITATKFDPGITVNLPTELKRYDLGPADEAKVKDAVAASLRLVNLAPPAVSWPLLLATYRAPLERADFALHLAGRTGTFKSEVSSLFQSHYGGGMDARHLPGSWSSTANAIEALAYRAKDALFVLDDFVPLGTSWQVRQLQKTADQIIRAAGNQAGRSRLTDASSLQQTYYPRGLILSTGEDVPEGHSVRGRMLILELAPGDVPTSKLSDAQAARGMYEMAMSDWIRWLAGNGDVQTKFEALRHHWRDSLHGVGHTRTPAIAGDLIATVHIMADWFIERGWWSEKASEKMVRQAIAAVREAAEAQTDFVVESDPVSKFFETIRTALATGYGHVRTVNGGIPTDADVWGWTREQTNGELPTYKARGQRLGWIDVAVNEFLFDPEHLPMIIKLSRGELSTTKTTLLKRINESGAIARRDTTRSRHTVRQVIESHPRTVIAFTLTALTGKEPE